MDNPKISVVMAVYNGEKYIREAIESILNQTFEDFEFIIVDDGSTDNSLKITKKYMKKDDRIILIKNNENVGVGKSSNKGLKKAKGKYIARMDDDDISLSTRLEKQYEFLENNPGYVAVGSWANWISADGKFLCTNRISNNVRNPKESLPLNMPIPHGGSLYRKNVLISIGGYKELGSNFGMVDTMLMIDLSIKGEFYNIPEVLNLFRVTFSSNRQRSKQYYSNIEKEIVKKYYYENKIDYSKIKYINKLASNVKKNNSRSYYYNRVGRYELYSNRMLAIRYLLLGFFYNPFSFRSLRNLFLIILPIKFINKN